VDGKAAVTADLLVLCPTRWRRASLDRFLASFDATREARTELLVITDDDDRGYDDLTLPAYGRVAPGRNETCGRKVNRHALPESRSYPAIGFFGDDITFETPGWDRLLLEKMPGISYPKDGRRDDVPESQVVDSRIIQALGWLHEPTMRHFWVDNVLAEIGQANDCIYFRPDVVCTHHHYHADASAARDATYALSEVYVQRDEAAFRAWERERRDRDCETVRKVLEGI
jgi:hypothetical protein